MHTLLIVVYDPVLKHLQRKRWKKERTLSYFVFANFANSQFILLRCVWVLYLGLSFITGNILSPKFSHEFPISVASWWYAGWCWPLFIFRSSAAYSSAIYTVEMKQGHQWEMATCWEQVFTCCSTPPTLPSVRALLILSPLQPSDWGAALAATGLFAPFPVLHMMSETHGCRT